MARAEACVFSHNVKSTFGGGGIGAKPTGIRGAAQADRVDAFSFSFLDVMWHSASAAKHDRRGSIHVKSRCFVPDYYNLPPFGELKQHKEVYEVD